MIFILKTICTNEISKLEGQTLTVLLYLVEHRSQSEHVLEVPFSYANILTLKLRLIKIKKDKERNIKRREIKTLKKGWTSNLEFKIDVD